MNLNKKIFIFAELLLFILALFFVIFSQLNTISSIAIILISLIIPFFIIQPYQALLFLIIIRNATDLYTEDVFINLFNIVNLNFSSILGILVILWGIYLIINKRINIKKIPLFYPWLLFLIMSGISLLYSVDFYNSFRTLTRLSSIFIIYISAYYLFSQNQKSNSAQQKQRRYFLGAIFISYLMPIILGIKQIILKNGFMGPEGFYRITGTFAHPNGYAFSILLLLIIITTVYFQDRKNNSSANSIQSPRQRIMISVFAIGIILILFTLTRSAWIALFLLSLVIIYLYYRQYIFKYLILLISLLFILIILFNYTPLRYFDLQSISFVKRVTTSTNILSSWDWRNKMWREMTVYIPRSPILGFGLDTYRHLREKQVYNYGESLYAHNDYLKILIELGIIGLLVYLNLIVQTLKNIYYRHRDSNNKEILISFWGILIIFLIALVDNILMATSLQWVMWIYIAYILNEK